MIKGIIRLENDISGRAGQLLILREDNTVHVVEPQDIEALFAPRTPDQGRKKERAPKKYGHYKSLETLLKAQANGRHMVEVRARRKAERLEAERLAAE